MMKSCQMKLKSIEVKFKDTDQHMRFMTRKANRWTKQILTLN